MGNELTREQQLALQIADYFNIDVPDIINEYVIDSLTVQRMIYALVTVRNTGLRSCTMITLNLTHFMRLSKIIIPIHIWIMTSWLRR